MPPPPPPTSPDAVIRPASPNTRAPVPVVAATTAIAAKNAGANVAIPGTCLAFPSFRAHVAAAKALGGRPQQQDEFVVLPISPLLLLLAVFDGHGSDGARVAAFARSWVLANAALMLADCTPPTSSVPEHTGVTDGLLRLFEGLARDLKAATDIDCYLSGTTALVAVLSPSRLYVANLGDSAAVISDDSDAVIAMVSPLSPRLRMQTPSASSPPTPMPPRTHIKLTTDHICSNEEEKKRVLAAGARVERMANPDGTAAASSSSSSSECSENGDDENGPLRIYQGTMPYPGLVVTRSLGDDVAHKVGVLSIPEIRVHELTRCNDFIIMGSDGLWDGCSPEEAVSTTRNLLNGGSCSSATGNSSSVSFSLSPSSASSVGTQPMSKQAVEKSVRELLTLGLRGQRRRMIQDNICTICVLLDHKKAGPGSPKR